MQNMSVRVDGSGCCDHDIYAIASLSGENNWVVVPGRHQTISIPAQDIIDVMSLPTRQQIVAAYKDLLVEHFSTVPVPNTGWSLQAIEDTLNANALALQAWEAFEQFLIDELITYPIDFNM